MYKYHVNICTREAQHCLGNLGLHNPSDAEYEYVLAHVDCWKVLLCTCMHAHTHTHTHTHTAIFTLC